MISKIPIEKSFDNSVEESKFHSDSDGDSALMEDAQSETVSSSITTTGSSSLSDDENLSNSHKTQIDQIEQILSTKNKEKLVRFAKSSGFADIRYRKEIWPRIIDAPRCCPVEFDSSRNQFVVTNKFYAAEQTQIESHRFYGQVRIDVERTIKRFPPNYSDAQRLDLQEKLIVVIMKTLIKQDSLNYYQGYHDICLAFLLVLDDELCLPFIDTITKSHFKDFMGRTMEKTRDLLSYLMPLLNSIDGECAEYMQRGGVGNVMFALSWFITWYSHVLDDLEKILRLYDLFIVSHFLMPVYVAAEIVRFHSNEVLSVDCDMPSLHQYLTRLPSELSTESWEKIIRRSLDLFRQHHPDTLDLLNDEWKKRCEQIENCTVETELRCRIRRADNGSKQIDDSTTIDGAPNGGEPQQGALPRIVLWGVTLTISGLAIYIWNQTQRSDPASLISLGDFLTQLYKN